MEMSDIFSKVQKDSCIFMAAYMPRLDICMEKSRKELKLLHLTNFQAVQEECEIQDLKIACQIIEGMPNLYTYKNTQT